MITYYSVGHVADAVGLKSHQITYLLKKNNIVEDKRFKCGDNDFRLFTEQDISTIVQFVNHRDGGSNG